MTKDVPISKNFTVEDIHKVREYNHELTKGMDESERNAYYKAQADDFLREAGIVPKNKKPKKTA